MFILFRCSDFRIHCRIFNWGLTGFRMGLSVMAATKLADAFLCIVFAGCYAAGVEGVAAEAPFIS